MQCLYTANFKSPFTYLKGQLPKQTVHVEREVKSLFGPDLVWPESDFEEHYYTSSFAQTT